MFRNTTTGCTAKLRMVFCFLISVLFFSCKNKQPLFKLVSSTQSGIHFNNQIIENDSLNVIDITNIYNGGGAGIGDFNNDGLQDVYFTGNMVENKLYINKGNFEFKDVTEAAKVNGEGRWNRGVAVIDINNDGLMDMYICASMDENPLKRQNILYVNTGIDKDNIPHFTDMAAEYGLNDTSHTTMASFFDYDNDGDLDVYLTVNQILKTDNASQFRPIITDGSFPSTGRLYRNDWDNSLRHGFFKNVSKEAGITIEGYGHSASITDFNDDGWKDIYVSNDFVSSDILYINNHDGTFTDKAKSCFKHTSANSMGQDVSDLNNDGLEDIVVLDMNPEDNYRKKTMMGGNNYVTYQNSDIFGYQYQYVRNSLQLNNGIYKKSENEQGIPIFSEISYFSGISETDWSWSPLISDFDNDGFRDIIITNGFPKDITDHDFGMYRKISNNLVAKKDLLKEIPEVKISNYGYKNNGDLTFSNITRDWGLETPSFSNGAAYADFDNDGDIDFVVNNINDEAFLYENKSEIENHYIDIELLGDSLNKNGVGSIIEIYYQGGRQIFQQMPYRGYLSSVQLGFHFGLGAISNIDSIKIKWPDGKMQLLPSPPIDKKLIFNYKNALPPVPFSKNNYSQTALFREITDSLGINYIHKQKDYIDFNIQKLLPHKFSEYCPGIAAGDINGDGLDDFIVGAPPQVSPVIFFQKNNGSFDSVNLLNITEVQIKKSDDRGLLLFDADLDGDLDLYISSGGYINKPEDTSYADNIYVNDGKGNFKVSNYALPGNNTSKLCIRACDYDKDGDLDLFLSGRVKPWNYPQPVSSYIYRNDSKKDQIKFIDVTSEVAPSLINIGMVSDGVWSDFDNDGWPDLIIAAEWSSLKFFKNNKGKFLDISDKSGIVGNVGWWNSIVPGDFDNDGDIDYIAGNLGKNSFYKASEKYPVKIYAKDFDNNNTMECILTRYLQTNKSGKQDEYTINNRDDVLDQLPFLKKRFLSYKSFAEAPFKNLFTAEELHNDIEYYANYMSSSFIRNNGNGKFSIEELPAMAQYSVLNGMVADDFDGDGNLDALINTNDYSTEVSTGRYDALNGLLLRGDGKGNFVPETITESGIFIPDDGKALVALRYKKDKYLVAASQNRGQLKMFLSIRNNYCIPVNMNDVSAIIKYKNGIAQKKEFYYGSSFLSQSSRFINVNNNILSVVISDNSGKQRKIEF